MREQAGSVERRNVAWGSALMDFGFAIFVTSTIGGVVAAFRGDGGALLLSLGGALVCSGSFAYAAHRVGVSLGDYFRHRLRRPL